MIRNRFLELCKHLKDSNTQLGFKDEQFEMDSSNMRIEDGGHNETVDGYHFANLAYSGTIYIERFPEKNFAFIAVLIKAWLDGNDRIREDFNLPPARIETIDLGDGLLDLLIQIDFIDEVFLTPDETGFIQWCGKSYSVVEYPVNWADDGTVHEAPTI